MRRTTRMKLRQTALSAGYFSACALLLFFNDFYIRKAPDIQQIGTYRPWLTLFTYVSGGLLGGALFSVVEFFLLARQTSRFGLAVLATGRAVVLLAIYVVVSTVFSFYYQVSVTGLDFWEPEVRRRVFAYITSPTNTINQVFYFVFALILVFFHQIAGIVGHGVLGKFLFARFKRPRVVEQVFVFLDLNSSTRIAEELGAARFFALIHEFVVEAGEEILEHGGEIYKYVGDEIIAVWPVEYGARRAQALACLCAIRERIAARSDYFLECFGHVPEFKSGIHVGPAIVGELGDWKREIAFMGDVLNTTARIQGACKKAGTWLLVSEEYSSLVRDKERWGFRLAGRGRLRGKDAVTSLYSIEPGKKSPS